MLLHFQPFTGAQNGSSKIVVEKLRGAPGAEAYRNDDRRNDKSVQGGRRDALRGREVKAAAIARALVGTREHGGCTARCADAEPIERGAPARPAARWSARSGHSEYRPALNRDPSTDVWRLLAALGIVPHQP
ncbi:hypothetical protein GT204_28400 [Streptomyces sp. SID4919]|uniref:hypothetical protein n=1 Tax=unclassified Streptomyces TaxID=2593676 RepID=UPI000823921E|nr:MULTISPECIES: hypothetical protein [unclassified Streptomyces]MYY12707.1 hypothetical protein [Streptomyces sp. SID4919]SCK20731.1 hypothetical protein YW7DRAFT_01514 [Streptomyces sp. AmelKG-E11A]